jgi:predicted DNA-binding transcriptional regulator AlpA
MIEPSELTVSQQIHVLCNLTGGVSVPFSGAGGNPLAALSLLDFLSALFFIASQYGTVIYASGKRHIDTQGKWFNAQMRNADIHELLCKAFKTYEGWPTNFFSFLDWRREHLVNRKHVKGLRKDFAEYKHALYRQLDSPNLNFMREAFEEYLSTHWRGGHISGIKRINHAAREKKRYVSFNEAVKLLKVSRSGLKSLISKGRLNAIVRPVGNINMTLIDLNHINELKACLEGLLSRTQAKSILGVGVKQLPELVEHNLLKVHHHPTDVSHPNRYSLEEIKVLLADIKKKVMKRTPLKASGKISFTIALRTFRARDITLGPLVKMVLDGDISPCGMRVDQGLGGILFYENEVRGCENEITKKTVDGFIRSAEAARLLGLQKTVVYSLIKSGLLTARKSADSNSRILFVAAKAIDSFRKRYVRAAELSRGLNTVSTYLIRLLIAEGVRPVSGPTIDGGKYYVFRKRDLKKINLEDLIDKERRCQRSRELAPVINLNEASKMLGISRELIQEHVENGILKTYKHQPHSSSDKRNVCFSRRSIENFKAQVANFQGLVSANVAASMLNKLMPNFYIKYVKTGRLEKVIDGKKRSKQFFRRKEVEALIELEQETIGSSDVAEILKVSMSSIYRMTVSKELRPISGPHVDGYPINLFFRSDVEELNRLREAFRVECVSVGKTTRFGKQPGRRSCPVQESVIYRVKQLLEEWVTQSKVKQPLTGLALHRQLVKEGYKIGTTTVYKMLNKEFGQSPIAQDGV